MNARPPATRQDHQSFCETEDWSLRKRATGRRGTHHVNHELALAGGEVLFTRISHPVDRTSYGRSMWAHILRDQLQVSADDFWRCVQHKVPPNRGRPAEQPESLPARVVHVLVRQAGLSEQEVRAMTRAEALAQITRFYDEGE